MLDHSQCLVCNSKEVEFIPYNSRGPIIQQLEILKGYQQSFFYKAFRSVSKITHLSFFNKMFNYYDNELPEFQKGDIVHCLKCGYGQWLSPPNQELLSSYYQFGFRHFIPFSTARYSFGAHLRGALISLIFFNSTMFGLGKKLLKMLKGPPKWDYRAKQQKEFVLPTLNSLNTPTLSALEIGGGACNALRLMREEAKFKFIINSVEPSDAFSGTHYQYYNINRAARLFPFTTNETYDYVHTSHWLEHAVDLPETISEIRKLLKIGGNFFIEVPDCKTYFQQKLDDTPHVLFFTKESLQTYLENNGFEVTKIDTIDSQEVITCLARKIA